MNAGIESMASEMDPGTVTADQEADAPKPTTPPSVFWQRFRLFVAALSLANLCLIHAWFASFFDKDFGYFNKLPVSSTTLLAMLCNLAVLTVFFFAAAAWVRRSGNRILLAAGRVLSPVPLLAPLDFVRIEFLHLQQRQIMDLLRTPAALAAVIAMAVLILWWHKNVARAVTAILIIFSPLALWTVTNAFLLLIGVRSITQDSGSLKSLAPMLPPSDGPRVLWVIFDELDYRVAFDHRPARVHLPELDQLASESFHATHACPPGNATIVSIPALLTGQEISSAAPSSPSELRVELRQSSQSVGWTQLPNVFNDARNMGLNAALVGWYHPYGRLFSSLVSYCNWYPHPGAEPAREATFFGTVQREFWSISVSLNLRRQHLRLFQQTRQSAMAVAANANYSLVFLHLPVPHKPGIYNAQKEKLTFLGIPGERGYHGNLMLADQTLGRLRCEMEAARLWDKTWIIISSDHWWRKTTGNPGEIDYRVPFLVKGPGRNSGATFEEPFNTIITRDLIGAIFRRELRSQEQVADWIERHRVEPPAAYELHPVAD